MSPQRSNRSQLIDGTLRCLERLPLDRVTARAIAQESGANLASITYHFGSKDNLVTEAVIKGLDRWLDDIARGMGDIAALPPALRYQRAGEVIDESRQRHIGLAKNFIIALGKAQHDPKIRQLLAEGFQRTRQEVATLLGLGVDQAASDAGGLALALFNGMLFQSLLDPALSIEGTRMRRAQTRLRTILPEGEITT